MLKVSFLAATALAAQYETENFVVSVQGASGGISVYPKGGAKKDGITVKQDKIEFMKDGKTVGGGFNVAGQNEWTNFTEVDGVLTSSFTTAPDNKGQSFGVRVDIASTTTEVAGAPKNCENCAANSTGVCQHDTDSTCAAQELDAASAPTGCSTNYTLCTHVYNVRADTVEFTPSFTGFVFPDDETGLSYTVELTAPEGQEEDVATEATPKGDTYSLSVGNGGAVDSANVALVQQNAGEAATEVAVAAPVVATKAGKTTITWNFPKEVAGAAVITFDPSISLSSPGNYVVPSILTTLGAFLALY